MKKTFFACFGVLLILVLFVGGCAVDGDNSDDTLCGPCSNWLDEEWSAQGDCNGGEECRLATDGNYYCFELNDDGSIDGICE